MVIKKILSFLCVMAMGSAYLVAQDSVTGTVVDRKGNPVPGAKVELQGSGESVITELDGTFRIETSSFLDLKSQVQVTYVGMQPKCQRVTTDMVVKLSKTTWWNAKPEKMSWLVSAQVAFPESGAKNPSFGAMLGGVKEWGWYVKGIFSSSQSTDMESSIEELTYWTTGIEKRSYSAFTAGVIRRLNCPIYAYLGVGYASRKVAWELSDNTYAEIADYTKSGAVIDLGLMLKVRWFSINGGLMWDTYGDSKVSGNLGIGVCF